MSALPGFKWKLPSIAKPNFEWLFNKFATLADFNIAFEGIQPNQVQSPPNFLFSTRQVLAPKALATLAANNPPAPPPITIISKSYFIILLFKHHLTSIYIRFKISNGIPNIKPNVKSQLIKVVFIIPFFSQRRGDTKILLSNTLRLPSFFNFLENSASSNKVTLSNPPIFRKISLRTKIAWSP